MEQYRIGTVAKLTGLTVHNLRAWEKRHQAFATERTESGRRVYSEATVERLKRLKACVDQGVGISTIAHLTDEQLDQTLAQLANTSAQTKDQIGLEICLIGSEAHALAQQLRPTKQQEISVHRLRQFADFSEFKGQQTIDILIVEQAAISATDCRKLASTLKSIRAHQKLLVYRYARQQDVAYLRTLGVHTLKAPVDRFELLALLRRLTQPAQTQSRVNAQSEIPERLYSDNEIQKAASLSSNIDCECPQHLAEIIKSLLAFERYSARCQSSDQAGADLHRYIQLRSAQARAIMENLMQSVLQQEGIDLQLIAL